MSPHTPEGGDPQKTQKIPSVVLDVQKSEPCSLLVGMSNGVIAMENSMKNTQKIKNKQTNTEPSSGPTSPLLGLHQKDVKARARKDICILREEWLLRSLSQVIYKKRNICRNYCTKFSIFSLPTALYLKKHVSLFLMYLTWAFLKM